jgi:hypothetical protein
MQSGTSKPLNKLDILPVADQIWKKMNIAARIAYVIILFFVVALRLPFCLNNYDHLTLSR